MRPLLEYKTVPIEIQVKTKSASLKFTRGTAEMEISRSGNGDVNITSRNAQVRMDSFQPRGTTQQTSPAPAPAPAPTPAAVSGPAPAPIPNPAQLQVALSSSYDATGVYADQGQLVIQAQIGEADAADQTAVAEQVAAQTAGSGAGTPLDGGSMEIRFNMERLAFDWNIEQGKFTFTPGDIKFIVTQRPELTFTYTGGPHYVPASSDPNYQPVDVRA